MTTPELTCLAHRYLYYVLARPVISDYEYDMLERSLPEDSVVWQSVGADCANAYPQEAIELAKEMLK